jgi:hypothetical protein
MLSLIETITGFAAIMLMLSLLVKTLTSVIKNQWDYYSDNLKHEVERLALETTGKAWDTLRKSSSVPVWIGNIHWERLGDEFLTPAYMSWFLKQLDPTAQVGDLESRLKIHVANVKYAFEMRMKNLALAVGLGLCLLCNINAFTIWKSLYTDEQLRATFSNAYAEKASELASEQAKPETPAGDQGKGDQAKATDKAQLDNQVKNYQTNMRSFLKDISFGVGRIWRPTPATGKADQAKEAGPQPQEASQAQSENQAKEKSGNEKKSPFETFMYEFWGSLLTGILVSIGAPYWHDILQALAALRPDKANA